VHQIDPRDTANGKRKPPGESSLVASAFVQAKTILQTNGSQAIGQSILE